MSNDLEQLLDRSAPQPSAPPPLQRIKRRGRWLLWRDRAFILASILVLAAGSIALVRNLPSDRGSQPAGPPSLNVVARILVDDYPTAVAFGEGSAWTITWDGTLQRIDPAANEVVATIPILTEKSDGAVILDQEGEPKGPAPPQPGRAFGTVTVGEGAVWVSAMIGRECTIFKVDPQINEIIDSVNVPGCYPMVAVIGSLWLGVGDDGDAEDDYLLGLDSQTLKERYRVSIGPCCMSGMAFSQGFLWIGRQDVGETVLSREGDDITLPMKLEVLKVEPTTGSVVSSVPLAGDTYHPGDTLLAVTMTATENAVWLTRPEAGQVDRIDPSSGEVVASIRVDEFRLPDSPGLIGNHLAVIELTGQRVALIDVSTNQVLDVLDSGDELGQWVGVGADSLWLTHPEADRVIRVGLEDHQD